MDVERETTPVLASLLQAAPNAMSASVKMAPPWAMPIPFFTFCVMGMVTRLYSGRASSTCMSRSLYMLSSSASGLPFFSVVFIVLLGRRIPGCGRHFPGRGDSPLRRKKKQRKPAASSAFETAVLSGRSYTACCRPSSFQLPVSCSRTKVQYSQACSGCS